MSDSQIASKSADEEQKKYRYRAAAFLGLIAGTGALFGFSRTLGQAKKQEAVFLAKAGRDAAILIDAGTSLAMRALAWGSLYALAGVGTFCFGIWKLSGAKNMDEFRQKLGTALPRLTRTHEPRSRTDFDGVTDFMKYLAAWGKE